MDNTNVTIIGGQTAEQVEALKAQHGKLHLVELVDGEEVHHIYLRRPDLKVLSAMTAVAKTSEIKGSEVLISNCFVAGSEAWRNDGMLFIALSQQFGDLVARVGGSLKNV